MSGSPTRPCTRCGKQRQVAYDRRNYCMACRDDQLRPIANWMEHGACRDTNFDPEWWWPDSGIPDKGNTPLAMRICSTCKVRDLCLDYAILHKEKEGIWGGLLPAARSYLSASRRVRKAM